MRYEIGSIPGSGPTPGVLNIAVYSDDGLHGYLLFAYRDRPGKFVTVRGGYRLTKVGSHWNADMGNGGFRVYKAVGKFVTDLEQSPRYQIRLVPRTEGCASPD